MIAITRNENGGVGRKRRDTLPSSALKVNPTHLRHRSETLLIVDCADVENMSVQL